MLSKPDFLEATRRFKNKKLNGHARQRYHALLLVTMGYSYRQIAELGHCVEKHIVRVDANKDAERFLIPELLDESIEGFAPYPVAILRGLKFHFGRPFPHSFVSWIVSRIPLYDWISL